MKLNFVRGAAICAVLLIVSGTGRSLSAAETFGRQDSPPSTWKTVNVVETNVTTRFITNLIEVRTPHNVFVTEYRTNWFERTLTNVVDVAVTNRSAKILTNLVTVNLIQTNVVDRFQTNWAMLTVTNQATLNLTNWETVVVTRTNWIHQPMTNLIEVNVPVKAVVLAKEPTTQPEARPEPPPPPAEDG